MFAAPCPGVFLALLLHPLVPGQEPLHEVALEELRARAAQQVDELAQWCQRNRLYLERDRLYSSLIQLDPGHREARRFLRYRRSKGGWEQVGYVPPENRAPEHLEAFGTRRKALENTWRADLEALLAHAGDGLQERERLALADQVLVLAPDDPEARARRNEVRTGEGPWILRESRDGPQRLAQLAQRAAELRAAQPEVQRLGLPAEECLLSFKEALCMPDAPVAAVGEEREASRLIADATVLVGLFGEIFGEAPALDGGLRIYVLDRPEGVRAFERQRAHDARARQAGEGLGSDALQCTAFAVSDPSAHARRERALLWMARRVLANSFGIGPEEGWASEGFALRLVELTIGPGGSIGAAVADESSAEAKRSSLTLSPWMGACALLSREARPHLVDGLLAKRVEALSEEERLVGYALARFLLEARPGGLARLLDELGRAPQGSIRVLEERLGMDLTALDVRLARWAAEVGA